MNDDMTNLITRALDGEATAEELKELKEWADANPDNARELHRQREMWNASHHLEMSHADVHSARQRVMSFILGDKAKHTVDDIRENRLYRYIGIAATIAAIAVIALITHYKNTHPTIPLQEVALNDSITKPSTKGSLILPSGKRIELDKNGVANTVDGEDLDGITITNGLIDFSEVKEAMDDDMTVDVPVSGYYKVALSDGSKVTLNSASTLIFPAQFTGAFRQVFLIGEAYFSVAKDAEHPFLVSTKGGMNIMVKGTQFNVNAYNPRLVKATLVSGSIVARVNNKEIVMKPNQQLTFSKITGATILKNVDPYADTAWKDGKLVFDNETIVEIMNRLASWYNLRVEYANDDVKRQTFTGSISRKSEFGDILNLIEQTADIHFTVRGNTVLVR